MGKPLPVMPPPGAVRNATPEMQPSRWWDMNLVRFRGGQLIPIGGFAEIEGTDSDSPPRDIITWHANLTGRWAAWGSDKRLYAFRFDTHALYDITPPGVGELDPPGALVGFGIGDYGEETYGTARSSSDIAPVDASANMGDWWSLDLFGQDLVCVPTQDGRLYRWNPDTPSTPAAVVPGAPTRNRGVFVTDERHVVLIGANDNPRMVAWSDQENPNSWTPTQSNAAGSVVLETEGRPMLGRRIAQATNLIWTDNDVHEFRYVGPPFFYGRDRLAVGCGLISPRAASVAGQRAVWMSQQGFFQYAGTVQPLACDVHDWLFSLINRQYAGLIFGMPNPTFREHWFYWPDEGSTVCNRYVAVNYGEANSPWIIGSEERTAGDTRGAMIRPIMGYHDDDGRGCLMMHEFGWTAGGASRVGSIFAETGSIALGDGDRRFHVTQIEQDFDGPPAGLQYRFFTRERALGAERIAGPYPILRSDGLVDCRFSARRVRMRVEATQDGPWALGLTRLDVTPGGSR